ncbi:glycosyltransferase [Phenylobacterium sp.]|uniref:glycosyltransferase n=1 Tax=Phenylobacterium sp. TaxID=1871053 RepID=UPI0025EF54A6|nr:glycosyltransferase [Phenylobacterium sp.]MBX3483760.1 glycosyltransferase [Phenylobacterium sp.]
MSAGPFVSVVVPHYQDLAGLKICMASLAAQTFPRDRFEIVVADNNSPVGLEAVKAVVGDLGKVVLVTEKGAGPARNGAVAASRGEILAFIDSDCVAEPQWLDEGVKGLERFDLVGGRVRVLVGDPAAMTPAEAFERVFAFDFKTYIEKKGFTGAGNMFCRRTLFERVGPFGVGLSEDVDWSRRAVAGGARLGYVPDAAIGHPARVTWEQLSTKWRRLNAETFGLMAGAPHHRLRWLARNALMPLSAVAHTPKVLRSPELDTVGQRAAALGVLYRLRFWRLIDAVRLLATTRSPG